MAAKTKLKDLSTDDLRNQLGGLRKEMREVRFNFGITRTVANPAKYRKARKDVARILTLLHERERAGN